MPKLGDHFPLDDRKNHIGRELRPGTVLYLDAGFTNPPKPKFAVVACLKPTPVLLLINSEINPNVERDPARAGCYLALAASDYPFLVHDSFLDCSKAYSLADDLSMTGQLVSDVSRIKGDLSPDDRRRVAELVRGSRALSLRIRRAIEAELGGEAGPSPLGSE
jgi:hypothetical protein